MKWTTLAIAAVFLTGCASRSGWQGDYLQQQPRTQAPQYQRPATVPGHGPYEMDDVDRRSLQARPQTWLQESPNRWLEGVNGCSFRLQRAWQYRCV
jgi:hypothetical protein